MSVSRESEGLGLWAECLYIACADPVIFIGDSATGKTHLLTGLAVA